MKLEKVTNKEKNVVELEISVPSDEFEAAVEKSYRKNVKKLNVPGFRKGKAPRKMVERMYGAGVFYDDAMEEVYPEAYKAAVEEAKIEPVDRANVEILEVGENGFRFKATVTVKPEIEIKGYKGLKLTKKSVEVTEADVAKELADYQKQQARLIDVDDRAAQNGDTVTIDFEGFVDGKAFDGGKAEGYALKLGSGSFIPGFEEQIVGKNIGDEFDVNVTFPEEYTDELKGKAAVFKIKLHEIKVEELPVLDDDFAKDVSEFDTLAEFTEDIKNKIAKRKEEMAEADLDAQISDKLAELVEGEIPECMYESEIDYQMQSFDQRLRSQGLNLDTYAKYMNSTTAQMRDMFRDGAVRDVKDRLALEKIAAEEKVIVEEADINEEYDKLAKAYGAEVDKIKSDYLTDSITKDLVVRKAFEAVKNAAEITEEKAEKKTAKKPAAKKTTAKKADGETAEKMPAAKKTTAKKADGETAEKKPVAKKTTAKKADGETAEKKPAAKKTAAKKTTKKSDEE